MSNLEVLEGAIEHSLSLDMVRQFTNCAVRDSFAVRIYIVKNIETKIVRMFFNELINIAL
ncbi:hypothetical protein [Halobacteriovorax sp. HLS]|uniref:hypothetical protein n=1 Tax=Halobacteriovorax sp. HLS TaxID=2234000 RepID=UPI000FDA4835|nr:hypothetical protein [Halobacteriovorax sp. HLS]